MAGTVKLRTGNSLAWPLSDWTHAPPIKVRGAGQQMAEHRPWLRRASFLAVTSLIFSETDWAASKFLDDTASFFCPFRSGSSRSAD